MGSVIGVTPVWLSGLDKVEGVDVVSDGHSYGNVNAGGTNIPRTTWFGRVKNRISGTSYTNRNSGGAQAADVAGITANQATPGARQLVLWDATINDVNHSAPISNGLSGYAAAVKTYLLIVRAGAKWEAEAAATASGTWSTVTDSYASGGSIQSTTAQNASYTFTVSGATGWVVLLGGGAGATSLGTVTVAVDGSTVSTVPLTGIYASTQNNGSRTFFPYAVQVTVPNTASHTITITKTDATTNPVYVDALLVNSVAPPLVVMSKAIYPTAAALSAFNNSGGATPTTGTVDTFNAQLVTTANSVATDGTILVADPQAAGFSNTTMVGPDGLHLNDYGAAFLATVVLRTVRASNVYVPGSGYGTGLVQNGAVAGGATVYAADTFTRANNATVGSTETGGFAWAQYSGGATSNPFSISSNKMGFAGPGTSNTFACCIINDGQSNGPVKATVTADYTGVIVRATANATGYIGWWNDGAWTISKRTATDAYSALANSTGVTPTSGDVVELTASGTSTTTLVLKVNGVQVATASDSSSPYTSGSVGVWGFSPGTFDDFRHAAS